MRPEDAALRAEWLDSYVAAGGEFEQDLTQSETLGSVSRCPKSVESAPCAVAVPRELPVGTPDYYHRRQKDFSERHGGPPPDPPSYYMDYGDKYRAKFAALTDDDLSAAGLRWRDCTLRKLQQMIEDKRTADPCGFADLERDDEAFKRFAYDTHPAAYTDCGLLQLPLTDLVKIGTTPELGDLLNKDGLAQVVEVLKTMNVSDVGSILGATAGQALIKVSGWFE